MRGHSGAEYDLSTPFKRIAGNSFGMANAEVARTIKRLMTRMTTKSGPSDDVWVVSCHVPVNAILYFRRSLCGRQMHKDPYFIRHSHCRSIGGYDNSHLISPSSNKVTLLSWASTRWREVDAEGEIVYHRTESGHVTLLGLELGYHQRGAIYDSIGRGMIQSVLVISPTCPNPNPGMYVRHA